MLEDMNQNDFMILQMMLMVVFFFCEISQNCKKKRGEPMRGLYNFKVVVFFSPNLNHHANQETTLMMDGLDPLLPKINGHDFLVVTLFVEHKTHHHFTQVPIFHHLCCSKLKFHLHQK
jgi:hypothetical protein